MRTILTILSASLLLAAGCGNKKKGATTTPSSSTAKGPAKSKKDPRAGTATLTPSGAGAEGAPAIGPIYFEFDSATLTSASRDELSKYGTWLSKNQVKVTIEGHADEQGTTEYNIGLGQRRAEEIANYLGSLGVDRGRLKTISFGEEQPAVTGQGEDAYSKNRRGEVKQQ